MEELEAAAADSLRDLIGGRRRPPPAQGAICANCGAALQGPFCHDCGQDSDAHKRSLPRLVREAAEGLFDLDGRLLRTLPDLFFRPGRLARDYMEGRIARHVPPFRTFLVSLLLLIFAAGHATHALMDANAGQAQERAQALATPRGRAAEAARLRAEASEDRDSDLKEAAHDRLDDMKDPDENRARIGARYTRQSAGIQTRYAEALAKADRVAKDLPPPANADVPKATGASKKPGWWKAALRKAMASPDYYLAVLFTWAHRMAILLLPILGFSLALVYRNKRRIFIYDHMLVAMNFLSFVFLANAVGLVLPLSLMGYWLGLVAIWTPINLFQTLRGAYGSSLPGALLKTFLLWATMLVVFTVLLVSLLVFSLSQL